MIAVGLLFNGIPNNLSNLRIELFTEQSRDVSDIGGRSVVCAVPVGLGEETEVSRRKQIFAFNANVINLGIAVRGIVAGVLGISNRLACLGQIAFVAVSSVSTGNAAVRISIRQVACFALAFAALRLTTVRQKYEILSRGQFGFRFGFRIRSFLGGELCVQSQIIVRHRGTGLVLLARFIIPAVESAVILLSCRRGNRRIGQNQTAGVRAFSARDCAAVQNVGQRVRMNVVLRGDVNLNGSVEAIGLGKVEAELILAVVVYGRVAESGRVEHYTVDGVVISVSLANQNRRNSKRTVVPELPVVGERVGTVSVLDVNLIGYAVVPRIVSVRVIYFISIQIIICPVGNVNLNHLRIVGANQIVEYQLVVVCEVRPAARVLCLVLKLGRVVTNVVDFSTGSASFWAPQFLMLSAAKNASVAEYSGLVTADVLTNFGRKIFYSNAVIGLDTLGIFIDLQRPFVVGVLGHCVGNPVFGFNRLNIVQAISVDVQRCHC